MSESNRRSRRVYLHLPVIIGSYSHGFVDDISTGPVQISDPNRRRSAHHRRTRAAMSPRVPAGCSWNAASGSRPGLGRSDRRRRLAGVIIADAGQTDDDKQRSGLEAVIIVVVEVISVPRAVHQHGGFSDLDP